MIYTIQNLRVRAVIGPNDWERKIKQNLVLNLVYACDAEKAAESDELADTLDYHIIHNELVERVEASRFNLVEKLADYVAGIVMAHKRVQWVEVEVQKPDALRFADTVSVKLKKTR